MKASRFTGTEHVHETKSGPPYDWDAPLTCPACCDTIRELREELRIKYGWEVWPEDCSSVQLLN